MLQSEGRCFFFEKDQDTDKKKKEELLRDRTGIIKGSATDERCWQT